MRPINLLNKVQEISYQKVINNKKIGLKLNTGFGKTYIISKAFQTLDIDLIFVLSFKKVILSSWINDVMVPYGFSFETFNIGLKSESYIQSIYDLIISEKNKKIIFLTPKNLIDLTSLLHKSQRDQLYSFLNSKKTMLVIDEFQLFNSETSLNQRALIKFTDNIKFDRLVLSSATLINIAPTESIFILFYLLKIETFKNLMSINQITQYCSANTFKKKLSIFRKAFCNERIVENTIKNYSYSDSTYFKLIELFKGYIFAYSNNQNNTLNGFQINNIVIKIPIQKRDFDNFTKTRLSVLNSAVKKKYKLETEDLNKEFKGKFSNDIELDFVNLNKRSIEYHKSVCYFKLPALKEIVSKHAIDEKMVVFYEYYNDLFLLEIFVDKFNQEYKTDYQYLIFNGKKSNVKSILKQWNEGNFKFIFVQSRCSVGLNLQNDKANIQIFFNFGYFFISNIQNEGRIARGESKNRIIHSYYLLSNPDFDYILDSKEDKFLPVDKRAYKDIYLKKKSILNKTITNLQLTS